MIRLFSGRHLLKRRGESIDLSFANAEEDYYYESDDDNDTLSTSTGGTTLLTLTRKPFKVVRFFQSRNQVFDDQRDCVDRNDWYSLEDIANFRTEFNQERKWMIAIDAIVGISTPTTASFGSVLAELYCNILKRIVLNGGQVDISKSHCRKLSQWLETDRAGLEKFFVPPVTANILLGRQQHREAVLTSYGAVSAERLCNISSDLSMVDKVFAQTTAVALAMVVQKRKRFIIPSRIVRK